MGSVSVNALVNDIMSNYDHNKNGVIEYNKTSVKDVILGRNEGVRHKNSVYSDSDSVNLSSTKYSREKLFYAADGKGNNDGQVTRAELTDFVGTYDKDNDGQLSKRGFFGRLFSLFKKPYGEYNTFNKEYREQTQTSSVSIPTGNGNSGSVYDDPFDRPSRPGNVYDDPFNSRPNNSGSVYDDPFNSGSSNNSGSVYDNPFQ